MIFQIDPLVFTHDQYDILGFFTTIFFFFINFFTVYIYYVCILYVYLIVNCYNIIVERARRSLHYVIIWEI